MVDLFSSGKSTQLWQIWSVTIHPIGCGKSTEFASPSTGLQSIDSVAADPFGWSRSSQFLSIPLVKTDLFDWHRFTWLRSIYLFETDPLGFSLSSRFILIRSIQDYRLRWSRFTRLRLIHSVEVNLLGYNNIWCISWWLFSDWSSKVSTHWKGWRKSSIKWFTYSRIIPKFVSPWSTLFLASNIDDYQLQSSIKKGKYGRFFCEGNILSVSYWMTFNSWTETTQKLRDINIRKCGELHWSLDTLRGTAFTLNYWEICLG
jgi:hypothetical protein